MKSAVLALAVTGASAFPWVANVPGVDSSALRSGRPQKRQQPGGEGAGSEQNCPFNPDHVPAAPWDPAYPYNYAVNGSEGHGQGGYLVPAPGDTAHYYVPAGPNDIRGPCPGLNAAANHNFLAHDGITTFAELVDAQQNLYNVGYDLATLLAALGLTLTDGDLVTEKLSIGCDATSRTSVSPALTGSEPGLDGHNKFEADSSLTRNDFFLDNGNDFSFNGTLFGLMNEVTGSYFDINGMSVYRKLRWQQSQMENPNFDFGPLTLLLYGAASFLYELMPNNNGPPDLEVVSSFFGTKQNSDGEWEFVGEQIPENWTCRATPYTNNDVTNQIVDMYLLNPVLFGGNTANGSFDTLNFGAIENGKISPSISPTDTSCLLYQLATGDIPSYANGIISPTVEALDFLASHLAPSFQNLGCPIPLTRK